MMEGIQCYQVADFNLWGMVPYQGLCIGLCCEVLSSGFSQISFGERKSVSLSPCHHGRFLHRPIEQGLGRLQKEAERYSHNHLVHLIICLLCSRTPLESIHMGTLFGEVLPHTTSPHLHNCHQFFCIVLSVTLTFHPNS